MGAGSSPAPPASDVPPVPAARVSSSLELLSLLERQHRLHPRPERGRRPDRIVRRDVRRERPSHRPQMRAPRVVVADQSHFVRTLRRRVEVGLSQMFKPRTRPPPPASSRARLFGVKVVPPDRPLALQLADAREHLLEPRGERRRLLPDGDVVGFARRRRRPPTPARSRRRLRDAFHRRQRRGARVDARAFLFRGSLRGGGRERRVSRSF
mmetsp:Transcript_334/g.1312  ORF Transcript_334/g.1312 Transcript_334/m.1312 type:complete len:210 (-) Transcript_334:444-1073(-)